MNAATNIGLLSANPTLSECTDSISGICILLAEYRKLLKQCKEGTGIFQGQALKDRYVSCNALEKGIEVAENNMKYVMGVLETL